MLATPYDIASMHSHGFAILPNLLSRSEVRTLRSAILFHALHNTSMPWLRTKRWMAAPDVLGSSRYYGGISHACTLPMSKPLLHAALSHTFNGSEYSFADMCDVQLNRSIGWHRDVLQGEYEKYKKTDLWTTLPSGETYGMARLILYLEDHSNASDVSSLHVLPGSHSSRGCGHDGRSPFCRPGQPSVGPTVLRPSAGDGCLIDMRTIHQGVAASYAGQPKSIAAESLTQYSRRVVVQLTFGKRRSVWTDEWRSGDARRRAVQTATAVRHMPRPSSTRSAAAFAKPSAKISTATRSAAATAAVAAAAAAEAKHSNTHANTTCDADDPAWTPRTLETRSCCAHD